MPRFIIRDSYRAATKEIDPKSIATSTSTSTTTPLADGSATSAPSTDQPQSNKTSNNNNTTSVASQRSPPSNQNKTSIQKKKQQQQPAANNNHKQRSSTNHNQYRKSRTLPPPLPTPIGLIDCEQIVHEPMIAPETCIIVPDNNSTTTTNNNNNNDNQQQDPNDIGTRAQSFDFDESANRGEITITPFVNVATESHNHDNFYQDEQHRGMQDMMQGEDHDNQDWKEILLAENVISLRIDPPCCDEAISGQQTIELHFKLGLDRYFLIGTPCRLLLVGILRLHQPCLEVYYGLNMLTISSNTMIFVNEDVVDVYAKIDAFEHVPDRRRIAFAFFDTIPRFGATNASSMIATSRDAIHYPEHLIYYTENSRRRTVALFCGEMLPVRESFSIFHDNGQNLVDDKHNNTGMLEILPIMNDRQAADRRFVLEHAHVSTIIVTQARCSVCDFRSSYFEFRNGTLKVAGYLAVRTRTGEMQLVSGHGSVTINSGKVTLYVDDHFAILCTADRTRDGGSSDLDRSADYHIEQAFHREKELRSISLMQTKQKQKRRSENVRLGEKSASHKNKF